MAAVAARRVAPSSRAGTDLATGGGGAGEPLANRVDRRAQLFLEQAAGDGLVDEAAADARVQRVEVEVHRARRPRARRRRTSGADEGRATAGDEPSRTASATPSPTASDAAR
jgi:hypothetical protein